MKYYLFCFALAVSAAITATAGEKPPTAPQAQTGYDLTKFATVDAVRTAHEKANLPTLIVRRPYGSMKLSEIARLGLASSFIYPLPSGFGRNGAFLQEWGYGDSRARNGSQVGVVTDVSFGIFDDLERKAKANRENSSGNSEAPLSMLDAIVMSELRNIAVASNQYAVLDTEDPKNARFTFNVYYGIKGVDISASRTDGNNELTNLAETIARKADHSDGKIRSRIFNVLRGIRTQKANKIVVVVANIWLNEGEKVVIASHGMGAANVESLQQTRVPGHSETHYTSDDFLRKAIHNALQDAINNLAATP